MGDEQSTEGFDKAIDDLKRASRALRILAWVQQHAKEPNYPCPTCGRVGEWIVAPEYVQPLPYRIGKDTPSPPSAHMAAYPQAMLTCNYCGYTAYFNAVLMGLVTSSPEK